MQPKRAYINVFMAALVAMTCFVGASNKALAVDLTMVVEICQKSGATPAQVIASLQENGMQIAKNDDLAMVSRQSLDAQSLRVYNGRADAAKLEKWRRANIGRNHLTAESMINLGFGKLLLANDGPVLSVHVNQRKPFKMPSCSILLTDTVQTQTLMDDLGAAQSMREIGAGSTWTYALPAGGTRENAVLQIWQMDPQIKLGLQNPPVISPANLIIYQQKTGG